MIFAQVLSIVLPIIVIVAIGLGWSRTGGLQNTRDVTAIVSDIATPCLIVSTFSTSRLSFESFTAMLGATAMAIALFAAFGAVILRVAGLRLRAFLPSIAFPNAGNLGLPIALYGFGQEGLGYAIAYFSISSVANYTLGQAIASGRADWRGLARLPILYAVAIGIALTFFRFDLPAWAGTTIQLLGNITVPVMLLLLGASLSQLRVASLGRAVFVSVVRLALGAAVGFGVASLLGLTGALRAVLILQCANPVAVYNYLFAQRWGNEPEAVAGVVVISTLLSLLTIPVLLGILLPG